MEINLKKTATSELMFGLFETVRGLFMTLSYAVKDIITQDEAVCCSIQYQENFYYVSFLHENFGKRGVLVVITPCEMIDLEFFNKISSDLNRTLKFTFGGNIKRVIRRTQDLAEVQHQATEEVLKLKSQLDEFFAKFNRRLLESTYFELFDNRLDDAKQALIQTKQLNFLTRLNVYREMRTKFMNSVPYFDLPFNIKTDLDSALVNLEAQEFVDDLERTSFKTRRLFTIKGSCLFFKVSSHSNFPHPIFLIRTHLRTF